MLLLLISCVFDSTTSVREASVACETRSIGKPLAGHHKSVGGAGGAGLTSNVAADGHTTTAEAAQRWPT